LKVNRGGRKFNPVMTDTQKQLRKGRHTIHYLVKWSHFESFEGKWRRWSEVAYDMPQVRRVVRSLRPAKKVRNVVVLKHETKVSEIKVK
jgi:hypothetical protein